ncbi:four helix bundle protein [Candidatus Margulisiibacteriota bacterium]
MGDVIKHFKDLKVWQKSHELELLMYFLTKKFPKSELFGLTNQLRRAVTSITANIAEGMGRGTYADRIRFYYNARGSIYEVESLICTAKDLEYVEKNRFDEVMETLDSARMLLNAFITKTRCYIGTRNQKIKHVG